MRLKYFVVLLLIIILCAGCSWKYASTTRNIRHSGFAIAGSSFKCDSIYSEKDGVVDAVRFYIGNYMITKSGVIYETNLGQLYSNDYNCRKPDFGMSISAVFDLNVVKSGDNYYYVGGNEDVAAFSQVNKTDNDYILYDLLLKESSVLKVSTINAKDGTYYVLKNDGNIYEYKISNSDNKYNLDSSNVVFSKNDYGSDIIDFNYVGSNSASYIRTTDSFYRYKMINSEQCSKYADVACEYKLQKDEELGLESDNILAYNGGTLITTYGAIFNVSN